MDEALRAPWAPVALIPQHGDKRAAQLVRGRDTDPRRRRGAVRGSETGVALM